MVVQNIEHLSKYNKNKERIERSGVLLPFITHFLLEEKDTFPDIYFSVLDNIFVGVFYENGERTKAHRLELVAHKYTAETSWYEDLEWEKDKNADLSVYTESGDYLFLFNEKEEVELTY